jgi:3'-5' exoribonuclease
MGRRTIAELQPGDQIADQVYLVADKDLRTTTNGGMYIHAVLRDRTGQALARMWQATREHYDMMAEGGLIRIRGRAESYKGTLQLVIDGLASVDPAGVDMADFLPAARGDVEAMWERIKSILRTVRDPDLLQLLKQFVEDEALVRRFKKAPAAIKMHHAYLGGLIEHTHNLLELAVAVLPRFPLLDPDLVIIGLFLHDIGKTAELGYDTCFQYTDAGQLVGHIAQAVLWIEDKARQTQAATGRPFPEHKKLALQHIVLAHHGQHEYGSPRLPATAEALAVHHLDVLDAKIHQALQAIADDRDGSAAWTGYIPSLGTRVYKGNLRPPE